MILITGSSGYIGSEIVNKFEKKNINYIGIDSHIYSNPKNIINKKRHIKIDISNNKIRNIIKEKKIDTVIHCAALSYVLDGENNKKRYSLNNIMKTKKFINLCKESNIKNFIFLSSSNVYSEGPKVFSEKNSTNPINFYGKTKIIIENFLHSKKFKNLIVLRLFNVVGSTKKFYVFKFKKENYQRLFFKLANLRSDFQINYQIFKTKKIFPKRDFIDIRDVSSAILIFLRKIRNKDINGTFNLGSGISTSTIDIYKKFYKNNNFKLKKISKKELSVTKANIRKLKKFLSWKPKIKIEDSIRSTLKFIRYT